MARNLAFNFRHKPKHIENRFYISGQAGAAPLVPGDRFEAQHLRLDNGEPGGLVERIPLTISRIWVGHNEVKELAPMTEATLELLADTRYQLKPLKKMKAGVLTGLAFANINEVEAPYRPKPLPEPQPKGSPLIAVAASLGFTAISLMVTLLKSCQDNL